MILYPAVDIRDGHAVRLSQGDYNRETVYDADPLEAASRWEDEGADWLHVVDLDGAREGAPRNLELVGRLVAAVGIPVELGGGLRDSGVVERAISAGVERVVLGTAAVDDPDFVSAVAEAHGDRVVVSVDTRSGLVARQGWTEGSDATAPDLVASLCARGVRRFVYTPVEADGLMEGPAVEHLAAVAEAAGEGGAELVYSGGVGSLEDLAALAALGLEALTGVVVGRALYERRFTVVEGKMALAG